MELDELLGSLPAVAVEGPKGVGKTATSERRANTVRDYLVSKGEARDKIETLGMGKTQPVPGVVCNQKALKELIVCLAPNRRVEVEVKGEATKR